VPQETLELEGGMGEGKQHIVGEEELELVQNFGED